MSLTLIVMVSFATPIQTRLSKVLTRPWRKRKAMNIVQITYVTTTRLSSEEVSPRMGAEPRR